MRLPLLHECIVDVPATLAGKARQVPGNTQAAQMAATLMPPGCQQVSAMQLPKHPMSCTPSPATISPTVMQLAPYTDQHQESKHSHPST